MARKPGKTDADWLANIEAAVREFEKMRDPRGAAVLVEARILWQEGGLPQPKADDGKKNRQA